MSLSCVNLHSIFRKACEENFVLQIAELLKHLRQRWIGWRNGQVFLESINVDKQGNGFLSDQRLRCLHNNSGRIPSWIVYCNLTQKLTKTLWAGRCKCRGCCQIV